MGVELWQAWLADEKRMAVSAAEKRKTLVLYKRATGDYLSVPLWLEYLEYAEEVFVPEVGCSRSPPSALTVPALACALKLAHASQDAGDDDGDDDQTAPDYKAVVQLFEDALVAAGLHFAVSPTPVSAASVRARVRACSKRAHGGLSSCSRRHNCGRRTAILRSDGAGLTWSSGAPPSPPHAHARTPSCRHRTHMSAVSVPPRLRCFLLRPHRRRPR